MVFFKEKRNHYFDEDRNEDELEIVNGNNIHASTKNLLMTV